MVAPNNESSTMLYNRVTGLPMIQAALNQAKTTYAATKQWSPMMDRTFATIESMMLLAAEKSSPYYEAYLMEKVNAASKMANQGLSVMEAKYPSIVKMTPEELRNYYDQTRAKKAIDSMRTTTQGQLAHMKETVTKSIDDLRNQLALLDHLKSTATRATKSVTDSATMLATKLDVQAKQYGIKHEELLLQWLRKSTAILAITAERILQLSEKMPMPMMAIESMQSTSKYLYNLDVDAKQAKTVWEVKDEVITDAKEKLVKVEDDLLRVLDKYSDSAPISWMHLPKPKTVEIVQTKNHSKEKIFMILSIAMLFFYLTVFYF